MEPDGMIINRGDIDFAKCVFSSDNKNTITTLLLKAKKQGYPVVQLGQTPFTGTQTTLTTGTYHNTFQNQVQIVVLDNGPEVAQDIIDGLANGSFVMILRNLTKGAKGEAEYQVYGYYQGLHATEMNNEKYSEDTDGGWLVTMQESAAPKSALFFFDTDSTTTQAKYQSLMSPAAGE
jgi:hypothetical protein